MESYNENDEFARRVQRNVAIDLYSEYWGVNPDDIREIDEEGAAGNELAKLLDAGGVDKIIELKGNLMLAQRIRRPNLGFKPDFTIRRQLEFDWDAEYEKLRQAYEKNGTAPSMYAYGQGAEGGNDLEFLYIVDFASFINLEFGGKLKKKESPNKMNAVNDPYYWENKGRRENGFYVWGWDELREHGLIEAEYKDGNLVRYNDRGNSNIQRQGFLNDWGVEVD